MKSMKTAVHTSTTKDVGKIGSYGSNANVVTSRLNKGGDMKYKGKRGSKS